MNESGTWGRRGDGDWRKRGFNGNRAGCDWVSGMEHTGKHGRWSGEEFEWASSVGESKDLLGGVFQWAKCDSVEKGGREGVGSRGFQ